MDYKQHWIRRQWNQIKKIGKVALIPDEHYLPSRSMKNLGEKEKGNNRLSSHGYSISTVALLHTLVYWSQNLQGKVMVSALLDALINRYFNGVKVPFQFTLRALPKDLESTGRNVSKMKFKFDREFKIHNGIAVTSEIFAVQMPKATEVLKGAGPLCVK